MTYTEFDGTIRAIISNTIEGCGGTLNPELVDASATCIRDLATENGQALQEQRELRAKLMGANGARKRGRRSSAEQPEPAASEPAPAGVTA